MPGSQLRPLLRVMVIALRILRDPPTRTAQCTGNFTRAASAPQPSRQIALGAVTSPDPLQRCGDIRHPSRPAPAATAARARHWIQRGAC